MASGAIQILNFRYSPFAITLLFALSGLLAVPVPVSASAAGALAVGAGPVQRDALDFYEVMVDETATLGIEDILAGAGDGRFAPATPAGVNRGFTRAALWACFSLVFEARLAAPMLLLLPRPLLDEVTLYTVIDGKVVDVVETGDSRPFASRGTHYRGFAFELPPRPGQKVDYILRVHSPRSASSIPLVLMDAMTFSHWASDENFLIGSYFGIAGGLFVAAVLLWLTLRETVFRAYCLYIGAFILTVATVSGYGMQLVWPQNPAFQQSAPAIFVALTLVLGVSFMRIVLRVPQTAPRLGRLANAIACVCGAGMVMHLLSDSQLGVQLVIVCAAAICPTALAIAILRVRQDDRSARFFLCGWLILMTGIGATALQMLGLVPDSILNAYGLYFGSMAEFVALALALGTHVYQQNRAREIAVRQSNTRLAALNENLEELVRERTAELEARNRELGELAVRDGLTGLYNHSASIELLEQSLLQAQRYGYAITVLMADIDHFKQVNDRCGHPVGDQVIEAVSRTLAEAVRDSDIVGRYGGEEFLVVMPHADATVARELGERLLLGVREIDLGAGDDARVTVSIGIAVANPRDRVNSSDLVERADAALYRAKHRGRNRLELDSISVVDAHSAMSDSSRPGEV